MNFAAFHSQAPVSGYSIALHGGAGTLDESTLSDEQQCAIHAALRSALAVGERLIEEGGDALDAVEATVVALEECPFFNAGVGACLSWEGDHELDAAIMDGRDLGSGAVAGVREVRSPIRAARAVMERSEHVLLGGAGADGFARSCGLEMVDNGFFTTALRREHWEALHTERAELDAQQSDPFRFGTVGAVARDRNGHLAAATSTGGVTNKRWGRIGDSPIIGAGTYADDRSCAISCTGKGELFIRESVGHEISARMRLAGQTLASASRALLEGPLKIPGGAGGLIAVDRDGRLSLDFNSRGMYRAWRIEGERACSAIELGVVEYMD